MRAGDTFRLVDDTLDEHLWVVLSDPGACHDDVVIVNLTTYDKRKDCTCILEPGDHCFIRHRTIANYRDARAVRRSHLEQLVESAQLIPQDPLKPEVLSRIREGAAGSRFTPEGCRKVLAQQGLVE